MVFRGVAGKEVLRSLKVCPLPASQKSEFGPNHSKPPGSPHDPSHTHCLPLPWMPCATSGLYHKNTITTGKASGVRRILDPRDTCLLYEACLLHHHSGEKLTSTQTNTVITITLNVSFPNLHFHLYLFPYINSYLHQFFNSCIMYHYIEWPQIP